MITLDPDMIGSLAPPPTSLSSVDATLNGKKGSEVPFSRLTRYERLKVSGKLDESDVGADTHGDDDGDADADGDENRDKKKDRRTRKEKNARERKEYEAIFEEAEEECH